MCLSYFRLGHQPLLNEKHCGPIHPPMQNLDGQLVTENPLQEAPPCGGAAAALAASNGSLGPAGAPATPASSYGWNKNFVRNFKNIFRGRSQILSATGKILTVAEKWEGVLANANITDKKALKGLKTYIDPCHSWRGGREYADKAHKAKRGGREC